MKRSTSLGCLGALAFLASGCVETTSALAEDEGERILKSPDPEFFVQTVPARRDVARAWQLPPSSPWSPYEKLTLPASMGNAPETVRVPRIDDIDELHLAERAAAEVARQGMPAEMLWLVDLRGAASVAFGRTLSLQARERVAVIPTFNNWPAVNELIPAEETLAAMIYMPPRQPDPGDQDARPVFLLDSWRLAFKDEVIDDHVVDNRYMLSQADFPSPEDLLARGITRVMYVVTDVTDALYEEDDLNELFLDYQDAGIEIHMTDIGRLAGVGQPTRGVGVYGMGYWTVDDRLYVRRRRTIVHDELFYSHAPGGFGGVRGAPIGAGHVYMFGGGRGGG